MTRRAWPLLLALLPLGCLERPKAKPLARKPSLYTRVGGQAVLTRAVDGYLARLKKAAKLAPGADLAGRKRRMAEELVAATGGPRRPRGQGLKELFSGVEVRSGEDFDAALRALDEALKKNDVGPRARGEVQALLTPLRGSVVGRAE
jgi:truncated hemoglobin YjbI